MTADITERRQAEEAIREQAALLNMAHDAIIVRRTRDEVFFWNRGAEETYGWTREEAMGHVTHDILKTRFPKPFAEIEEDVVRMGRWEGELTNTRKDGQEIVVASRWAAQRDESGRQVGVLEISRDITERKRAEVALRRLNDELEQGMHRLSETNRELESKTQENEAFVYSVSHDLRSPLVNLQGFSKELSRAMQLLRADLVESDLPQPVRDRELEILDGPMAKATHFIQMAVARLSGIIDALLRLSRVRQVVYQRRCLDMQAIVTRIINSLRGTAEERGAAIETGDLPAALGDPAAVEQIFANLIGNALNYLDRKRPGRIEVGSLGPEQDNAGAGLRTYYVRDNGLGITEAGRAKVFQPFQRLYPQAAPGEGMGLAIVHRVVERHGGRIWFESVANQGSTFFVALPAFPDKESPASPIPSACSETRNQPT